MFGSNPPSTRLALVLAGCLIASAAAARAEGDLPDDIIDAIAREFSDGEVRYFASSYDLSAGLMVSLRRISNRKKPPNPWLHSCCEVQKSVFTHEGANLLRSCAMRPLRYSINITLDGCCDHRAGIGPDEELHRHHTENLAQADALLFGRVTYEMMESAWRPLAQTGARPDWMADWMEPFGRTIDAAKKYVVSSTLERVDWNAELVRGDLGEAVRQLKREPGKGLFVGGVMLPLALAELGLIDEYELVMHPRLAGHGPTLFAGLSKPIDLKLVGRLELGSGIVAMRYEPRR